MLSISIGLIFILSGLTNRLALLSANGSRIVALIGFVLVLGGSVQLVYRRKTPAALTGEQAA